jgi:hypothetical protein
MGSEPVRLAREPARDPPMRAGSGHRAATGPFGGQAGPASRTRLGPANHGHVTRRLGLGRCSCSSYARAAGTSSQHSHIQVLPGLYYRPLRRENLKRSRPAGVTGPMAAGADRLVPDRHRPRDRIGEYAGGGTGPTVTADETCGRDRGRTRRTNPRTSRPGRVAWGSCWPSERRNCCAGPWRSSWTPPTAVAGSYWTRRTPTRPAR